VHNANIHLKTALCVPLVQLAVLYIFSMILNVMQHVLLDIMGTIIHVYNVIIHVMVAKYQPLIAYNVLQIIQELLGIILVLKTVEMVIIHKSIHNYVQLAL
jgi:hypothetical protein